jgi:preprotein translocase subunit YajC
MIEVIGIFFIIIALVYFWSRIQEQRHKIDQRLYDRLQNHEERLEQLEEDKKFKKDKSKYS